MTQIELEKWVCSENITNFQDRLNDPCDESLWDQLGGLLAREQVKLQTMFAD